VNPPDPAGPGPGEPPGRRRLPRSFKDLTPSKSFDPRSFFREMVWKPLRTRRHGEHRFFHPPKLSAGEVAITWIGHASFLIQFDDLNILIDPNFANWLFLLKRLRRTGIHLKDLPGAEVVLLSHAHFDHFHKPTLRRLPSPRLAVVPWGVGELTRGLGFDRVLELEWWETFTRRGVKFTLTPSKHWGARTLSDHHRGYGGFVIEHQGRKIYHAGDSAYFEGFKEIGQRCAPEIALLPIGAYHPEGLRNVHMGPEDAIQVFRDLAARWLVPMHYGTFRLSFEDMDEPPLRLRDLARRGGLAAQLRVLEEGVPHIF
jgi:L-ascorbate metabolism protein UlaG (beta-lactamase superfamily)